MNDDERLEPERCGHSIKVGGSVYYCTLGPEPHSDHGLSFDGRASRGLGFADDIAANLEITWRDDRPVATVGDVRRALARTGAPPIPPPLKPGEEPREGIDY
jgi:hypothetical protein